MHLEALRREIHDGLNVGENWNSANGFIFYGKVVDQFDRLDCARRERITFVGSGNSDTQ